MKKFIVALTLSLLPLSALSVFGSLLLTSAISNDSQSEEIEANQSSSEEIGMDESSDGGTMPIVGYDATTVSGVIEEKASVLSFLDDDGTERSLAYVSLYCDDQNRDSPGYFQAGVRCKARIYLDTCTDPSFPAFPDVCKGQIVGLFCWNSPMAN
jgi:hypothetical protein